MSEKNASDCTRCGLCKNVCPVYKIFKDETVSPRAKNITFEEFLADKAKIDGKYFFEYCTGCQACKEVCPIDLGFQAREIRAKLVEQGYKSEENQEMIENIKEYGNPFGQGDNQDDIPDKLYCC